MTKSTTYKIKHSFGYLMGRGVRLMRSLLDRMFKEQELDISMEQYIVLVHLWQQDGLKQQELANFAGKDKTTLTRGLHALEKRNWVVRVPDQLDKRIKRIFLTHKGKEIEQVMMGNVEGMMEKITSGIAPERIKICKEVLMQMHQNMEKELDI